MSLDKIVSFMIEAAREKEREGKPAYLSDIFIERAAKELIGPAKDRLEHHRNRERHYTTDLEAAEKKLREEGVTVGVWDPSKGYHMPAGVGHLTSGRIPNEAASFQPQIDQAMLDAVKHAKGKMIEHRDKAEGFEKWVRLLSCAPPDMVIKLTKEDVHYFQLKG